MGLSVHRIVTSQPNEAMRRLREHGFDPSIAGFDERSGRYAVDWTSEVRDLDLDFLRPDILPPR